MRPKRKGYTVKHGGSKNIKLDFSVNTNPYTPPFLRYINLAEHSKSYPICELERMLAEKLNVCYENLLITAGITEALYLFSIAYIDKETKVVILDVTYKEYERLAKIFKAKIEKIYGINPEIDEICEKIDKNSVIFFCNPNNPTGKFYSYKEVKALVDAVEDKDSILFLDEAYIDFVEKIKNKNRFIESENVVVARSFTKSYGIPSIRLGYIFSNPDNIKILRSIKIPWSVDNIACKVLEYIIKDRKFLKNSLKKIFLEKNRIEKELRELNIKSDANFFILKAPNLYSYLKAKGISVRNCENFSLKDYIRFSVRKKRENNILIKHIKDYFSSSFMSL